MKRKKFSRMWKSSKSPRKQRKFRANLPMHLKKVLFSVHLSKPLREKYGFRSFPVRKGDKVRVLRGQFVKSEGKVDRVDRVKERLFIGGVEVVKKDGSKSSYPVHPSNVLLVDFNLDDKRRVAKLNGGKSVGKVDADGVGGAKK